MNQTRREMLWTIGGGFAGIAASHLLARDSAAADVKPRQLKLNGGLHHVARVRRIIQLFMTGGASPMDTFDYKPELEKLHGQKLERDQVRRTGNVGASRHNITVKVKDDPPDPNLNVG